MKISPNPAHNNRTKELTVLCSASLEDFPVEEEVLVELALAEADEALNASVENDGNVTPALAQMVVA
jgi:hypothetical protein